MQTIKLELKLIAKEMHLNESRSMICPFCEEEWKVQNCPVEWKPETSFKLTRVPAGLLYICFRASCGKSGLVTTDPLLPSGQRYNPKFQPRFFTGDLIALSSALYEHYIEPYGITQEDVIDQGIKYAPDEGRIYYPLYDMYGYMFGETLKTVYPNTQPKSLHNFWSHTTPHLHFPLGQAVNQTLVLVEDVISAIKISNLTYCAALLGSHITEALVLYLKEHGVKEIIIMLDSDATGVAAGYVKKYQGVINTRLAVCPKGKDPKDLTLDELRNKL
jgi:hypothetical protein